MQSPSQNNRLRCLFDAAVELSSEERASYLEQECVDPLDREKVQRLLAADDSMRNGSTSVSRQYSNPVREQRRTISPNSCPGYELLGPIGSGGMGEVYAARDLVLDREVAIKIMLPGANAQRFITESKITARLPHPGIPPVHALGTLNDGASYLVMKLVRGRTLAEIVTTRGSFADGTSSLVHMLEQIAQAVGFAHAQGIIHRDLKPQNIMVGEFGEVQVMDWGLAKDVDHFESPTGAEASEIPAHVVTNSGTILGTPGFMSPEQARGEVIDFRSDVFALGSILAVILTGEPAVTGANPREIVRLSAAGALENVFSRLTASNCDDRLIQIAGKCLAADPIERYPNAQVLAEELTAYRGDVERRLKQAETERAAALVREAEQRKRWRMGLWGAGLITLTLLAGIAGTSYGLWQAQIETVAAKKANVVADRHFEKVLGFLDALDFKELKGVSKKEFDRYGTFVSEVSADFDIHPPSDAKTLCHIYRLLGSNLFNLGDFRSAVVLLEKAHTIGKQNLAETDPEFIATLMLLGRCYQQPIIKNEKVAFEIEERAVQLAEKSFGKEHPTTALAMQRLGSSYCYRRIGNSSEKAANLKIAVELLEPALAIQNEKLDSRDEELMLTRSFLATAYRMTGQPTKALSLEKLVYEWKVKKYGTGHFATLDALSALAQSCEKAGCNEEAMEHYEELIRQQEFVYGPLCRQMDFPIQARVSHFTRTNDVEQLIPALERQLAFVQQHYPNSDHVLRCLRQLTPLYIQNLQGETAAKLVAEYSRIAQTLGTFSDDNNLWILEEPIRQLWNTGQLGVAEELLREELRLRKKKQRTPALIAESQLLLGIALVSNRKYRDAKPLLMEGYQTLDTTEQDVFKKPCLLNYAIGALVQLSEETERFEEADKWKNLLK